MSRDDWFDALARDSARGLSRRQVFGRLLGGTGLALFSFFGLRDLARNDKDCGNLCHLCCANAYPDRGREYGQCVSDCQHGQGLCGPVCQD
jgi:hypothetical protein